MKSLAFIFLLVVFISSTNAENSKKQDIQRTSIYLHPLSIIFSSYVKILGGEGFLPLVAYSTIEIPLSLSNSFIINPSLWFSRTCRDHECTDEFFGGVFRLGSGFGIRHFVNKKGEGLYLQAIQGIHYYSITYSSYGSEYEEESYAYKMHYRKERGVFTDLLGYLGYSSKFSNVNIFLDAGGGLVVPIPVKRLPAGANFYEEIFAFDFNFGIGLPW